MPTVNDTQINAVRGKVVRFTEVDACGMPLTTLSSYVTRGVIAANMTANRDTGDEIKVRLIDGTVGTYEPGRQTLLNFTVEIQVQTADPGVFTMLTGNPVVLSADGSKMTGWREQALQPLNGNYAVELWTDSSGTPCSAGAKPIGYTLFPFLQQGYINMDNVTDKEITFTITAMSYGGSSWGKGPYMPVPDSTGTTPGRLVTPIGQYDHKHFEITTIAAPAPTPSGPQTIVLPTPY